MKKANGSSHRRSISAPPLKALRSAVSNGTQLFMDRYDQRGAWSRRLRDLIADTTNDLGGLEAVNTAEKALIRRASMLCLQCELMEQNFASNEDGAASAKQLDVYQRTTGALRRTLKSSGLHRRPRDVTPPSLKQYLHGKTIDDDEERAP